MRWTILENEYQTKDVVTCRCSCGTIRQVNRRNLEKGRTKSCGCLQKEMYHLPIRFATKYVVDEKTKCWNWTSTLSSGRAQIRLNGKYLYAARVSYELFKGVIPEKLLVLHTCDNPKCVNPDHLFLGTHQDNVIDAINKGRFKHLENIAIWNNRNKENQNES